MAKAKKKSSKVLLATTAEKKCREIMDRFTNNWNQALRVRNLSVNDLAREYGDTRQNIQSPLRSSNATMLTLCKMAEMVDCTVEDLITETFVAHATLVKTSEITKEKN